MAVPIEALEAELLIVFLAERPGLLSALSGRYGLNNADAEDVLQTTFLHCWKTRRRLQPESLKQWIWRVAFNASHDLHRRRYGQKVKRLPPISIDDVVDLPTKVPEDSGQEPDDDLLALRRMVAALPKRERVVVMDRLDGLRFREIADKRGIPQGTAKTRALSAKARLRKSAKGVKR
jgi:RNA polymerase sigma-70 factor (ECF subfamily)